MTDLFGTPTALDSEVDGLAQAFARSRNVVVSRIEPKPDLFGAPTFVVVFKDRNLSEFSRTVDDLKSWRRSGQ